MRIVAMSDTHGYHRNLKVPDGDLLIHAGDFSMRAKLKDVVEFARWFKSLPHKHKILVPGNHDVYCEFDPAWAREEFFPAILLAHEECEIEGRRIFGSPYSSSIYEPSPWSFDYRPDGPRSKELWSQIPDHLSILITHGPPKGMCDLVDSAHIGEDPHVGDLNLLRNVERALPSLHIFGHIHEGYGNFASDMWSTSFHNVSVCDVEYRPVNPVSIINL